MLFFKFFFISLEQPTIKMLARVEDNNIVTSFSFKHTKLDNNEKDQHSCNHIILLQPWLTEEQKRFVSPPSVDARSDDKQCIFILRDDSLELSHTARRQENSYYSAIGRRWKHDSVTGASSKQVH